MFEIMESHIGQIAYLPEGWVRGRIGRCGPDHTHLMPPRDCCLYSINPEKTFIKDYKKIKPTKIFCLDVFEHILLSEIKEIVNNFKEMSDNFELIVSIPTGNFISRKVRKLVGKSEIPEEHITSYKEILKILKENFKLKRKINFFTVTKIFVFGYKGIKI